MPAKPRRRRAPRGPGKSEILNIRVKPLTKRALVDAAKKRGRTLSAECEFQLQRALFEMGGPTRSVINAVASAIDELIRRRTSTPGRWVEDSNLFDVVLRALVAALEMFRPEASTTQVLPERPALDAAQGRAVLLELLAEIAALPPDAPLEKLSSRQRALSLMKEDLGDLLTRPPFQSLFKEINANRLIGGQGNGVPKLLAALAKYEASRREQL
jgi:hypothetical protein